MNQFTPKSLENVAAQAKEQYEGLVKAGQEQTVKQFEQTATAAKEQFEKTAAQLLKSYEDLQATGKANVEALIASSTSPPRAPRIWAARSSPMASRRWTSRSPPARPC
ncbi:hypothetical protein [Azospirillum sp. B506]|uniref:hypothetical protein n=1 Tax=Azospirillum sp. B506 TaxID=137721 RepID=UPI00034B93B3|nr:hypothetical protein [Azospirillum sp. B506]